MRVINLIVVHCSATPPDMDIGVDEIRRWHVDGNGWSDIGYHYVIRRSGELEPGRPVAKMGAHAKGHNGDSIGICMVGGISENGVPDANFTARQYHELAELNETLSRHLPITDTVGHRDISTKSCPCFDVKSFLGVE